jgi:predicted nucleic acid-binding protein
MKALIDTWVIIEHYLSNPDATAVLRAGEKKIDMHISHITIAEVVNVISRTYGEREARVQYAYLKHSPLKREPTTEGIALNAGFYKTKYKFSLADAIILATAVEAGVDVLVTGGEKQYQSEWRDVDELDVMKLADFKEKILHL